MPHHRAGPQKAKHAGTEEWLELSAESIRAPAKAPLATESWRCAVLKGPRLAAHIAKTADGANGHSGEDGQAHVYPKRKRNNQPYVT